jgi:nitrogen fixation protein NifU and related proteins
MRGKDPLEELVKEIQEQILEEERQLYSPIVLEETRSPYHMYEMPDAHGTAMFTGVCGDTMWVYLKVDGKRIAEASFVTDGCGATVAVGSRLMKMVEGRGISDVLMMTDDDLVEELGGLPPENLHCASLAVTALYKAIDDLYAKGVIG